MRALFLLATMHGIGHADVKVLARGNMERRIGVDIWK
jgi:hypothetical protein